MRWTKYRIPENTMPAMVAVSRNLHVLRSLGSLMPMRVARVRSHGCGTEAAPEKHHETEDESAP
jgi:hypothetical protein